MADISGQLRFADDSGHEKTFMRRSVMVVFGSQPTQKKNQQKQHKANFNLYYLFWVLSAFKTEV